MFAGHGVAVSERVSDAVDRTDLEELERDVRAMRDALDGTRSTAESDDGFVEVTVSGRGEVLDLVLDPRIYRQQDSGALAADILDVIRRATEQVQRDVLAAAGSRLLPPDVPVDSVDLEFDSFFEHIKRLKGRQT
jgi:DNA-binding protein YbaB